MKTIALCCHCGASLNLSGASVGRNVRCSRCRAALVVTDAGLAPRPLLEAQATVVHAATDTDEEPVFDAPSHAPDNPTLGKLGRFELRRALGRGAFGQVYAAYDPQMDRVVALKAPRFAPDEKRSVERFLREAQAAGRLRHPNIVAVFERGRVGDTYYIASEYVDGVPLSSRLADGLPEFRQAAAWIRDLARALAYAHGEGIVHRDIKPANILLDGHDRPQLCDFGLAKRLDDDSAMTIDGSVVGTPSYMSPEQARGETAAVGPRSDQYSLGAVLYELLTGQAPFDGPSHVVLRQVAADEPPSPRRIRPEIPQDLEAICQKSMEKDPAGRYPSALALAEDVECWLEGRPIAARRIGPVSRLVRWGRRQPALAASLGAAAAALLLAALLGVGLALYQSQSKQRLAKAAADLETKRLQTENALQTARAEEARAEQAQQELQTALASAQRNLEEAEQQRKRADDALRQAQKNFEDAERQKQLAQQNAHQAEQERQRADAQSQEAERQKLLAQERERIARGNLYATHMYLAYQAIRANDKTRARELLSAHLPREGEPDLRSFEWRYLWRLSAPAGIATTQAYGIETLRGHRDAILAIAFSAAGDHAYSFGSQGWFAVWNLGSGAGQDVKQIIQPRTPEKKYEFRFVAVAEHGDWFAVDLFQLAAWNPAGESLPYFLTPVEARSKTGNQVRLDRDQNYSDLAFTPDGSLLAGVGRDTGGSTYRNGSLQEYGGARFLSMTERSFFPKYYVGFEGTGVLTAITFPSNETLAVADANGAIYLANVTAVLEAPQDPFRRQLLPRDAYSTVLPGEGTAIAELVASPEGEMLASIDAEGKATVWDLELKKLRFVLSGHRQPVSSLAFSADGKTLASGDLGGTIKLWDAQSGLERLTLVGHTDAVTALAFSPTGETLASGGKSGVIRLWWGENSAEPAEAAASSPPSGPESR
jgi:WD40 repeat protein